MLLGTLWLSGVSLVGALAVGIVACAMRISRFTLHSMAHRLRRVHPFHTAARTALFLYFGLPSLGIQVSETSTGIPALTLNSGAYMAEIIRAGVQSIPHGQIEAAVS